MTSSAVTASIFCAISSGESSSVSRMTLRPTRFILAAVLSRARRVELFSCCLVRSSSSASTRSVRILPISRTITSTASSTLPVAGPGGGVLAPGAPPGRAPLGPRPPPLPRYHVAGLLDVAGRGADVGLYGAGVGVGLVVGVDGGGGARLLGGLPGGPGGPSPGA